MKPIPVIRDRIKSAWEGRISGCQLGKPVEILANLSGLEALTAYLRENHALPLRGYIPYTSNPLIDLMGKQSCKEYLTRSEPDDDINYTVLALMMLEEYGLNLSIQNVALSWLRYLPAGKTFTAEKAAYSILLAITDDITAFFGLPPGFDLSACSHNQWSDWIGAQIRADMYGWVCPGQPSLAADLARRDASLSHRGDGIDGAVFVAALGAAIPASRTMSDALEVALKELSEGCGAFDAVKFGRSLVGKSDAIARVHERYMGLPPVHVLNNLALVVWGILSHEDDFSAAIGDVVAAGLDTDCNGATVGGLWGLSGKPIPEHWTKPWQKRVAVDLGGIGELNVDDLIDRTVAVANRIYAAMPQGK